MTLQGGDREYGHGDQITVQLDPQAGSALPGGAPVEVTGRAPDGDHVLVKESDGSGVDAVLGDGVAPGGYVMAHFHGVVHAKTGGDDPAVGDLVADGGGALTEGAGDEYLVLEGERADEDGTLVSLVQLH
jgi:hypothetical protein